MTFYKLSEMPRTVITPEHSTAEGPTIKGRRIEVGYYRYPAGTGAKPHAHPEEQVITVLKGRIRSRVGRDEKVLGPGEAVYIPRTWSTRTGPSRGRPSSSVARTW